MADSRKRNASSTVERKVRARSNCCTRRQRPAVTAAALIKWKIKHRIGHLRPLGLLALEGGVRRCNSNESRPNLMLAAREESCRPCSNKGVGGGSGQDCARDTIAKSALAQQSTAQRASGHQSNLMDTRATALISYTYIYNNSNKIVCETGTPTRRCDRSGVSPQRLQAPTYGFVLQTKIGAVRCT